MTPDIPVLLRLEVEVRLLAYILISAKNLRVYFVSRDKSQLFAQKIKMRVKTLNFNAVNILKYMKERRISQRESSLHVKTTVVSTVQQNIILDLTGRQAGH